MTPSLAPVHTILSVSGTIASIDIGWPGNRSLMLPHSPQLKISITPSSLPHTTFAPFWPQHNDKILHQLITWLMITYWLQPTTTHTRKQCCRTETARCRKCSFRLKFANNIPYKYKTSQASKATLQSSKHGGGKHNLTENQDSKSIKVTCLESVEKQWDNK